MSQEDITEVGSLGDHVGASVTILGWVESTRSHGKVGFVILRDGTGLVQGVLLKNPLREDTWALLETLTQECSVALTGEVREEARAPGGYELGVTGLELLGASEEYPIQPKEHGVEFLLDHRHLWLRSTLQRAGLRVRHEVEQAIHDFFYDRNFVRIDTPILTGSHRRVRRHAVRGRLFRRARLPGSDRSAVCRGGVRRLSEGVLLRPHVSG